MALAMQVLFVESNQPNIQEEGWWHLVVYHGRRIHALNLYTSVDTNRPPMGFQPWPKPK
jgi:hypothetical protein